ncbi:hypothetical protein M9H77_25580 [Catharanthus roseus]|uniref:Uncharacterized protein n=1 Tax=Catharanthus roseus TaxID=4058 RepID=A0ACC0A7A1_CATRO|nr:hypothetical protein M9H77_25580 [Catharanthus roseus]
MNDYRTIYESLQSMELKCFQEEAEVAQRNRLQGRGGQGPINHTGGSRSFIEWRKKMGKAKYQELKAKAECLHIETGSPMLIDDQLTFEATGGNNKGHVRFWLKICSHHHRATGDYCNYE